MNESVQSSVIRIEKVCSFSPQVNSPNILNVAEKIICKRPSEELICKMWSIANEYSQQANKIHRSMIIYGYTQIIHVKILI